MLQTDAAGTGVEWASNIDVPGTLDVTGAATFDSTITANTVTYTFPGADGTTGQHLTTNGSGSLSWSDAVVPNGYGTVGTQTIAYVKIDEVSTYSGGAATPGGTVSGSFLYRYSSTPVGLGLDFTNAELGIGNLTSLGLTGTWRTLTYIERNSESYVACLLIRIS